MIKESKRSESLKRFYKTNKGIEQRKAISKRHTNKIITEDHKKKISLGNKNKIITKESTEKRRITLKQTLKDNPEIVLKRTEKRKKTLKDNPEIMISTITTRKQTYIDNPQIMKDKTKKRLNTYKDNPEIRKNSTKKWIKTLDKNPDIRLNMVIKRAETFINNPEIGIKKTKKWKDNYYNNPKWQKINSERMKKVRKKQKFPFKDSKPEVIIQNFLKELKVEFIKHVNMTIPHAYECDILIPTQEGIKQKTIIECDGEYWHMNPNKYSANDIGTKG